MNSFKFQQNRISRLPQSISTFILLLGAFVVCFTALKGHTQISGKNDSQNTNPELLSTLEQIVALYRQQTEIAESNYKSGRMSSDALAKVVIKEQKARIKLAKYMGHTQNQSKALESIIQFRKQHLNRLRKRQEVGTATSVDVMNAEILLLKSECALLKLNQ